MLCTNSVYASILYIIYVILQPILRYFIYVVFKKLNIDYICRVTGADGSWSVMAGQDVEGETWIVPLRSASERHSLV